MLMHLIHINAQILSTKVSQADIASRNAVLVENPKLREILYRGMRNSARRLAVLTVKPRMAVHEWGPSTNRARMLEWEAVNRFGERIPRIAVHEWGTNARMGI